MVDIQTKLTIEGKHYTIAQIQDKSDEIMRYLLRRTREDVLNWILKYVPVRTGQLRDSLINWVRNWKIINNAIEFDLATFVEYAKKIKGDPKHANTWFEHSGAPAVAFYGGHSGFILLDDPLAESQWFFLIRNFTAERINSNLQTAIISIVGG